MLPLQTAHVEDAGDSAVSKTVGSLSSLNKKSKIKTELAIT